MQQAPAPHHECLNRAGDVLQIERTKLLESKIEPVSHMITHRSRDADATRRAFGLESCCHVYRVPVQIGSISNRIAEVYPDTKADGSIGRLIAILHRNLLLYLHGTAHRSVNAIEHDEQGVASCLDDFAAMLIDRRVDHLPP
jgi:hypothetical protein